MSFDSLYAYRQGQSGIETGLWPPAHAYLMHFFPGTGGLGALLALQVVACLVAPVFVFRVAAPEHVAQATMIFLGLVVVSPATVGALAVHWRDVPVAGLTLIACAAWLSGLGRAGALLALLALSAAAAFRFNAIFLVGPLLVLILWSSGRRGALVLCPVATIALVIAWASTVWRMPDLQRLPETTQVSSTQEFDLIGISACSGRNYLPAAATGGVALAGDQLRAIYDPRHFLLSIEPEPGRPPIYWIDADSSIPKSWQGREFGRGKLGPAWRRAIAAEPLCYLRHRLALSIALVGLPHSLYATHAPGIDRNDLGLRLANPQAAAAFVTYVAILNRSPFQGAAILLLGAVAGLWFRRPSGDVGAALSALWVGSILYLVTFALAAPGADARYMLPCTLTASMTIAVCALSRARS